jgi:hypothetical protein
VAHPRWHSATQWAVSDGHTKIVRDLEGRWFAYDVSGPEERPVSMSGESVLVAALQHFQQWSAGTKSVLTATSPSGDEVERLRALGYVR